MASTMKIMRILAAAFVALAAFSAAATDSDASAQAQIAAQSWLRLTDSGQYGESWGDAASVFKAAITEPDWAKAVSNVRAPLGAVKTRQLKSATFARSLPGAPEGEYVVIRYETEFANKSGAIETVTPMRDKDGAWRVSGYYVN